jgi:hypothetical protein
MIHRNVVGLGRGLFLRWHHIIGTEDQRKDEQKTAQEYKPKDKKKNLGPESASELHRPIDRRLSEKLVPTFADRGCHVVSVTDPYGLITIFLTGRLRTQNTNPWPSEWGSGALKAHPIYSESLLSLIWQNGCKRKNNLKNIKQQQPIDDDDDEIFQNHNAKIYRQLLRLVKQVSEVILFRHSTYLSWIHTSIQTLGSRRVKRSQLVA